MPFSRGLGKEVLYICISGVVAILIFYVSPFGFAQLGPLYLLGFGVVSVLAGVVYVISTHYLYEKYWNSRLWTVGWEIIHSLCFLLFIGIGILLYGYFIHVTDLSFKNFLLSVFLYYNTGIDPGYHQGSSRKELAIEKRDK